MLPGWKTIAIEPQNNVEDKKGDEYSQWKLPDW